MQLMDVQEQVLVYKGGFKGGFLAYLRLPKPVVELSLDLERLDCNLHVSTVNTALLLLCLNLKFQVGRSC